MLHTDNHRAIKPHSLSHSIWFIKFKTRLEDIRQIFSDFWPRKKCGFPKTMLRYSIHASIIHSLFFFVLVQFAASWFFIFGFLLDTLNDREFRLSHHHHHQWRFTLMNVPIQNHDSCITEIKVTKNISDETNT